MMKLAIFDMDGTLTCSTSVWNGVTESYFTSIGCPLPSNYKQIIHGFTFVEAMEWCIKEFGLTATPEKLIYNQYLTIKQKYAAVGLKPHVQEYLQYLQSQGVRTCVATLANDYIAKDVLTAHGIYHYFDFVLSAVNEQTNKREPDLFLKCAAQYGLLPGQCTVFEDSAVALHTAKSAGFCTVGVEDPSNRLAECGDCDMVISDYLQLIK